MGRDKPKVSTVYAKEYHFSRSPDVWKWAAGKVFAGFIAGALSAVALGCSVDLDKLKVSELAPCGPSMTVEPTHKVRKKDADDNIFTPE